MAKQKIIKSDDLKLLKIAIIADIDEAQIQASVYDEEKKQQERTKQDLAIIEKVRGSQKFWLFRKDVLHECLVKIEKYSSEIEI